MIVLGMFRESVYLETGGSLGECHAQKEHRKDQQARCHEGIENVALVDRLISRQIGRRFGARAAQDGEGKLSCRRKGCQQDVAQLESFSGGKVRGSLDTDPAAQSEEIACGQNLAAPNTKELQNA